MIFLTQYTVTDWRGNEVTMAGENIEAESWKKAEASFREPLERVIGSLVCIIGG